jgi:hypothetical protein
MSVGRAVTRRRPLPAAVYAETYPTDPDFPQLGIATDPQRMLELFRTHLKPIAGTDVEIRACIPFRFRCRQSGGRCVLQYTLRLADSPTGLQWDQWVTGVLYAQPGEAERLWRELSAGEPRGEIPEAWLTFEPVDFIPQLQMLVQVFPYDRKLRQLGAVLGGSVRELEPKLLTRLRPGNWIVTKRTVVPTRYRTELGAALRLELQVRDSVTAECVTLCCYLKVFRNDHGEETFAFLRASNDREETGSTGFAVVRPLGYLRQWRTLALEEATGATLQQLLLTSRASGAAARAVARAVAAFNLADPIIDVRHALADQLADVHRAATLVQWACPETRPAVRGIVAAVAAGLEEVAPAPIHRDLKPDHVFLSGGRVRFIDCDSVALGDPARDPAHLFAHILGGVGLEAMSPASRAAAALVFVEEYFAHVPAQWRRRFHLHCAGALVEVAAGIFKRQEPNWRRTVPAVVAEAEACLRQ